MRLFYAIFLVGSVGVVGISRAEIPAPAPDTVSALITRLADADYHVRRQAAQELRQVGDKALPALRQAMAGPDPEVRARARQIVRAVEFRQVPGRPPLQGRASSVSLSFIGGERAVDVNDAGRKIHIVQGPRGIEMTVTGITDGRPDTETYRARTAEQLKTDNPEAYALFERWSSGNGPGIDSLALRERHAMIRRQQLQLQQLLAQRQQLLLPQPPVFREVAVDRVPAGGDDLTDLRGKVEDQMRRAGVPEADQRKVVDALDELDRLRRLNDAQFDNPDLKIQQYNAASDAVRKRLSDLKLPDPGAALPPPSSSRLGISAPSVEDESGVAVTHVLPHSRADRIGLQEGDIIRKVNGQPVRGVKDLRRVITENPKQLELEITRDGREMKLQEK